MPRLILLTLVTFSFFVGACSDTPERHERGAEAMAPPLPAMSGSETFLNDQLLVEATVGSGLGPHGRGGPGSGGRGRRGEGGGYSRRPPEGADMMGGGPPPDREFDRDEMRPRVQESHMPVVVLQLHATNKGTSPLEITWVECNSALGNFGVLPEKMTLAPGESADTEHMRSLLGASGEDIPVTVTLRAHGKTEKKTITVRALPDSKRPTS